MPAVSMPSYLEDLFGLTGKTAVIIGGGGYLCGAMAQGLARSGVQIVVADRNEEAAGVTAKSLTDMGSRAIGVSLDVTQRADHERVLKLAIEQFSCVDILINGAGINAPTPFFDITLEQWHAILDSHITGTFLACQVFGHHMVENKKGSIINISSASAGPPLSKAFTYSVAKAGIKNLTQNLAREWAPDHVRVNALRPGFFPTQWSKKNFITAEREQAILSHTPMRRYGQPSELVGAVLWLASDAASFVTGSEVAVDGGFSAMTI